MKRGRGKKINAKKQKQLSEDKSDDKILMTAAIVVFVFLFISLAFVNVPQNSTITGHQTVPVEQGEGEAPEFIKNLFTNFPEGLDDNIAKYVIMFTLFTFVLGLLNLINFPPSKKRGKGSFLRFLAAIGISFLATAYLIPENVFAIVMSFETLALMLMFIPFAAVILISAILLTSEEGDLTVKNIVLELLIWIAWVAIVLFRLISAWIDKKSFLFLLKGGGLILLGIAIASLVILIVNKAFREKLRKIGLEITRARAEDERARIEEGLRTLRNVGSSRGGYEYGG